jgi:hypothetical protein
MTREFPAHEPTTSDSCDSVIPGILGITSEVNKIIAVKFLDVSIS